MKTLFAISIALTIVLMTMSEEAQAQRSGFRLLGTVNHLEAKDMNGHLNSLGLTDIKRLPGFALELNSGARGGEPVEFGLRFQRQHLHVGVPNDSTQSDFSALTGWNLPLILRFYFLDTPVARVSGFVGAGPSWASLETRKNGYKSQYELAMGDLRITTLAAGSLELGYEYVYLVLESGYQWNKIGSVTRAWQPQTGAMNTLDLSGMFISIGIAARLGPSGG